MRQLKYAILGLMLFTIVGCNRANKESTQQQTPEVQQPAVQPAAPPAIQEAAPQAVAPTNTKSVESSSKILQPEKKPQALKKAKNEAPVQKAKEIPAEEMATPGEVDTVDPSVKTEIH